METNELLQEQNGQSLDHHNCSIAEYGHLLDLHDKLAWLQHCGEQVNPTEWYESAERSHLIDSSYTIEPLDLGKIERTMGQINSLTGYTLYQNYVGFELDENRNILDIRANLGFHQEGNTFSFALFRGVARRHELKISDKIEFYWATLTKNGTSNTSIIFKVTNLAGDYNYNFSKEPNFIGYYDPR